MKPWGRTLWELIAAAGLLLAATPARADCVNPAGVAGAAVYNSTYNVPQYCDGADWISFGVPNTGAGSGGCSSPSGPEGAVVFSSAYGILQYCDGSNWLQVPGPLNPGSGGVPAGISVRQVSTVNTIVGNTVGDESESSWYNTVSFPDPPLAGSTIILGVSGYHNNANPFNVDNTVFTDTFGNTYEIAESIQTGTHGAYILYTTLPANASNSFKVMMVNSDSTLHWNYTWGAIEVTGLTDIDALDVVGNDSDTATTTNTVTTSGSTTQANELAVAVVEDAWSPAHDSGNGWSEAYADYDTSAGAMAYKVLSSTGTVSHTWTHGASNTNSVIATFKGGTSGDYESNLIHHWTFDENSGDAADSVGTMTAENGGSASYAAGIINNAASFGSTQNENNAFVAGGNAYANGGPIAGLSSVTFTAWVNLNSVLLPTYQHVIYGETTTGNCDVHYFTIEHYEGDTGSPESAIRFRFSDSGSTQQELSAVKVYQPGQWYHVAVVYDATNDTQKIYINGYPEDSNTYSINAIPASTRGHIIGNQWNGACDNYPFNGLIDDVRVYDTALTAGAIWNLFLAGNGNVDTTSNLVGHWPLDETSGTTAEDISGNGNNGAMQGGLSGSNSEPGIIANALHFDGTDDEITLSNESNFDFDFTDPFTITAWFYRDTTNTYDVVFSKGNSVAGYSLFFPQDGDCAGATNNCITVGMVDSTDEGYAVTSWSNLGTDDGWHHVAATYSGDPTGMKIYLDGFDVTNPSTYWVGTPSGSALTNDPANIGDWGGGTGEFDGLLDDVRVYNRALSPADIYALAGGTPPGFCADPVAGAGAIVYNSSGTNAVGSGLIHHWKLDEGTGTSTADSAGSTNGTLTGSPSWTTGEIGNALSFANTTVDYVSIPDDASFTFNPANNYTWSFWINPSSFDEWSGIWAQEVGTTVVGLFIYAHTSASTYYGPITNGVSVAIESTAGVNVLGIHSTDNALSTGNWALVTVTYDASQSQANRVRIYVNGSNVTDTGDVTSLGTLGSINPTNIGIGRTWGTGEEFHGLIDDARMYNRVLTAGKIQDLYTHSGGAMQYCNGTQWISIGKQAVADVPCTAPVENFTSTGMTTTTVPNGCETATLEAWGAGGGGGFSTTTTPGTNNRAGGGGGASGIQRGTTMLVAGGGGGGGGNASGSNNSNHRAGGGGGYVIASGVAVTEGETLNVYVGAGGASSCSAGANGAGGGYNGTSGAAGSTPTAVTNPPGVGGGGGNSGSNNGGASTYGGGGGNAGAGSAGTSTYGGAGGSGAGGGAGTGYGGTVTNGTAGSGANTAGTGASGGGFSAGNGATGNNCSNVGGNGRARITWSD